VVCRHVSLTNKGVPRVNQGCGTLVSYPLFVRRHFVVCRHVSLTNKGVPRVKQGCGTLV
jgi:hypothetical protein